MPRPELPMASRRSREDIERLTEELIARFYPWVLSDPGPVPVDNYVQFKLPKSRPVSFFVSDLPFGLEAVTSPARRAGRAALVLSTPTFNALERGFSRARFTAAHEAGHAHLHIDEIDVNLVNGAPSGLYRAATIPPDRHPERQANWFAAAFLMPAPAVRRAVQFIGSKRDALAEIFQVSYAAMGFRLDELGIW